MKSGKRLINQHAQNEIMKYEKSDLVMATRLEVDVKVNEVIAGFNWAEETVTKMKGYIEDGTSALSFLTISIIMAL